jgi:hypothetical protein
MKFRPTSPLQNSDPDAASTGGGETVDTTVETAAPAVAPAEAPKSTMLEAMFGQKQEPAPTEAEAAEAAAAGKSIQQLRDDKGRFAGKAPGETPPDAKKPDAKPDPNAMPEGLSPKAQERFQSLANTNKELTAQLSQITQMAGSIERAQSVIENALGLQEVFQQHGVRREQFDLAMDVVGMMNRGDLNGALQAIEEQRRMIALAMGKPLPGVDALSEFPDLRQKVDNLQLAEEDALELARNRVAQRHTQQQSQRHTQEQNTQQQAQQASQQGQLAVDRFCKARMADDMDYARIEPLLLKEIEGGLLADVPPQAWARIVEKTYGLIKQTASATRASGPTTTVLRPTGGESPRTAPNSTFEAMFGGSR